MACLTPCFALSLALTQPATEAAPATVHQPGGPTAKPAPYDLEVGEVEIKRPEATYRLTARRWKQIVREDPELWHLHKRGRLLVPGIVFLGVSTLWLSTATAVYVDFQRGYDYSPTATEALFQWVFPSAMFVAGAMMTYVGVKARRDLRKAQQRLYVSPYASRGAAGLTVGGRF